MNRIFFSEEQKFSTGIRWLMHFATIGMVIFLFLIRFVFILEEKPGIEGDITILFVCIVLIGVDIMFMFNKLKTELRKDGVYYQFLPFQRKFRFVPWSDIEKAWVRKYNPLREFGGWGVRVGMKRYGRAYNVRGNMGLQIELKNGKKILIGTQRHEEMQKAITRIFEEKNDLL